MTISHKGPSGYTLEAERMWIKVKGFQVLIAKTDEGVVVDIYDEDRRESIASAYAFDGESER